MVDGGFSHNLARAFASYLAREPCEQVTVVEVDFPTRVSRSRQDILSLWMRGDIGFECRFMRILRLDEQIMSIRKMLRADLRPPPVGSSNIDHCTDFQVAARHAPERAVGGHVAKRGDFRRLDEQFFR